MFEIRFHGRGGQGTVLAVKILADAVLRQGERICLAIPEFGVERRGAPVTAYARISDKPILIRTRIYEPDALVVLDPTLYSSDILNGLKPGGSVLTNAEPEELSALAAKYPRFKFVGVPALRIARELKLGSASSPVVNTAMCGAAAALFRLCGMEPLLECVREAVPGKADANCEAARRAFDAAREAQNALA
ncbi:MAG: 2-oxoacid:acceptor oxidoreductase family protein [Elusimicrobia bacterium]|nr:2-oxoacid:acceptor oxidoreductase family protein [Elusimicrobiota bacterium]